MDTLYKHIPFYIRLDRDTKKAVGVFYHNFYESVFNMGREKSNYWPRYTYFQADGGDLDCFLIGGDTIARVVDNYTLLTGRPALLPKRALGYQGSSMYYPELEKDSDDAVLGFVDTIKEEGFPIDGFHLSSGYTSQNNKRCVFTWNTERFKDPSAYFHAMNEKHAQNVPNVKPGVLLCNPRFDEFNADDVFVKDSKDPENYGVGKWWGGDGAFWDFTKPEGRTAWKKYLTESIIAVGTDSVWNDNCEYDSLMDKDDICDFDGKGGTIGQLKPIMSTLMCKVGADAVVEHNAKARPYMVCRSGSAGIQRYAQTWCGDNYTSWKSLKYNIPIITGMGLSGQPNEGADIGGFAGPCCQQLGRSRHRPPHQIPLAGIKIVDRTALLCQLPEFCFGCQKAGLLFVLSSAILSYSARFEKRSRKPLPAAGAERQAGGGFCFRVFLHPAVRTAQCQAVCVLHRVRAGRACQQPVNPDRLCQRDAPAQGSKLPPRRRDTDDAAILYSQHFQLCRAAVGTAGSIARHLVCCHPLSGFQRAGRPRVHPQVYQHFHFPRAPPGEQRFHRLLGTAAAPEEHHGALSPRDDHGRSVPAPGQLHPDDLPVQDVPQTNGQRRRQHQTGQCHPRPDTPVVRQPPQPQQQQADEGGAGSVKIDLCPGPAGYPEGPSVQTPCQRGRAQGAHPVQRGQRGPAAKQSRGKAQL